MGEYYILTVKKVNYSTKEYQRIFVDIFEGVDDAGKEKKLILFGSGRFTERFLFQFGNDYPIYSIIDNNSSKWGTLMNSVPINSPDILYDIPEKERHIIICIKVTCSCQPAQIYGHRGLSYI